MSPTTLVVLSWSCFILSFAVFSSFVGDIERLTAADTPSLDSSGLFVCQQKENSGHSKVLITIQASLLVNIGRITRMTDS